jgi:hypothetical protein
MSNPTMDAPPTHKFRIKCKDCSSEAEALGRYDGDQPCIFELRDRDWDSYTFSDACKHERWEIVDSEEADV